MYRFRFQKKKLGAGGGPMGGTLYIPSLSKELNILKVLSEHIKKTAKMRRILKVRTKNAISTSSHTSLGKIPDNSIDYIFTDPPFGGNLMYSELNFINESWLEVITNNINEAIVNRTQGKDLSEYQDLMTWSFYEAFRILKPNRWITVEFHNSKNSVWNAIQEAILRAGFMVADVRLFDKKQGTFNQVTTMGAVKQDLIISAYKPKSEFENLFQSKGGSLEGAWAFIREHLGQLPIPMVQRNGLIESLAERQAFLLYDRMVAFHIQRGLTIPLSAPEFYLGMSQRFLERDEMYFTPEQAAKYDKRRLRAERVEQLALFVNDEKSAIQWLRQQLSSESGDGPQTYQDISPKFMKELRKARHEDLPELQDMLEDNFLKDGVERWYIPDPDRQGDLEALRQKALLREFKDYLTSKKRLRTFRSEAVRAGFSHAWKERDYATIVQVAGRLPSYVLEEDQQLLMYYHNASLRYSKEPKQPPLI